MIDWTTRLDELAFHLSSQFRMEDRIALQILLSALLPAPHIPALWIALESNYFFRYRQPAWFSFAGLWLPLSLPAFRTLRSRDANKLIAQWLSERPRQSRLFVECDYDGRPPYDRPLCDSRSLLASTVRMRVTSTPDSLVQSADERIDQRRADHLRALTSDVQAEIFEVRKFACADFFRPDFFGGLIRFAGESGRRPSATRIRAALRPGRGLIFHLRLGPDIRWSFSEMPVYQPLSETGQCPSGRK